jgi:hypothetical protein
MGFYINLYLRYVQKNNAVLETRILNFVFEKDS